VDRSGRWRKGLRKMIQLRRERGLWLTGGGGLLDVRSA